LTVPHALTKRAESKITAIRDKFSMISPAT
jgi:hypothetical protein